MDRWQSKLPAAIDGLVAVFKVAEGLTRVTVLDGVSVSQSAVNEVVSVGYTGNEDEQAAESSTVGEGLGGLADREAITIRCVVAVVLGGTDMAAARKRVYELFTAAGDAVAANRTLNGAVMRASIGSHSLAQYQTDQGAQAVITFAVDCDSYTR